MTIVPFLRGRVFGHPDIHAMSSVLDDVCGILHLPDEAGREKERLATQIIALARQGHRDAGVLRYLMLREIALAANRGEEVARRRRNGDNGTVGTLQGA
jgi:hypothetical protein